MPLYKSAGTRIEVLVSQRLFEAHHDNSKPDEVLQIEFKNE
ncbi:hypothetical protein ACU8KH_02248 [Lachancea thermotolerans]